MTTNRLPFIIMEGVCLPDREKIKIAVFKDGDTWRFRLGIGTIERIGALDIEECHAPTTKEIAKAVLVWLMRNPGYRVQEDISIYLRWIEQNRSIFNV
jgi:hypothetical protein